MRATVVILFAVALAMFGLSGGVLAQDEAPVETIDEGAYGSEPLSVAQEDTGGGTCDDYPTRESAQAALDDGTGDTAALDANGNGLVCDEGLFVFPDESLYECGEGAAAPCEEATTEPCTDETCLPPGTANSDCGTWPEPGWAQSVLDSGVGDPAVFDPDGDGIACNHDDEPVAEETPATDDDTEAEDAPVEVAPDNTAPDETSAEQKTTEEDAVATVPETTGDDVANDDTGGNDSVTLPSTGIGVASTDTLGGFGWLVAGLAVAFGGAAYGLRRRLA